MAIPLPIGLLQPVGILLGTLVALHIAWAVVRPFIFFRAAPPAVLRLLARIMADAMRNERDLGDALRAAAICIPVPWSRAACDAGDALHAGVPLPEALHQQRLLPRKAADLGNAAFSLGGTAPQRWLDDLAATPPGRDRLVSSLAPAVSTIVLASLVILFISRFIVPQFEQVCLDIGIRIPPNFTLLAKIAESGWTKLAVPLVLLAGIWLVATWGWRSMRRRAAAGLIASATAAGVSEAAIAEALDVPEGDLAAICRACGWRARDREGLLRALAAEAAASERRAAWLSVAVRIAVPLVLAVPVWLIASGMFGTLVHILTALEKAG